MANRTTRRPLLLSGTLFVAALLATAAVSGRTVQAGQVCLSCWYATPVAAGHPSGGEDDCAFADQKATCQGIDLSGKDLRNRDWQDLNLQNISLSNADLTDANLQNSDLRAADLSGANLARTNLHQANLSDANLTGVRWSLTVCPDGTNSDDDGGSCASHLRDSQAGASQPGCNIGDTHNCP